MPQHHFFILKTRTLTPKDFLTSKWSGGSSTQLYIFPANANFEDRNFEFRISTAKVAIEESTFTALPGVDRKLMILEGEICINHQGQYSKKLKPFEADEFSGDWKTTAIGTCTDFNVMTRDKLQSELYHVSTLTDNEYTLKIKETSRDLFLYATSGTIQLQLMDEDYTLESGNLMVIEDGGLPSITINSVKGFGLVVVEIY